MKHNSSHFSLNPLPHLTRQLLSRMCGMALCLGFLSISQVHAAEILVGNAINAVGDFTVFEPMVSRNNRRGKGLFPYTKETGSKREREVRG